MLLVKLDTGFNIEVELPVCPFHKRLFAWIIDMVLQFIYLRIISEIVDIPSGFSWIGAVIILPILFYYLIWEIALNGQTPGKMALRIRVITEEGGQPSIGQHLTRWLFRSIDLPYTLILFVVYKELPWFVMPLIFTGLVCVIFTPRSQRVGDLLAGTILIDLKNKTSWEDTVFTEVESDYKPKYPKVMQLSDRDINTLKSIIESVRRKNDYVLATKIADRIKSKLKMETDQDAIEFLQTLLKDYNYYSTN